MGEVDRVQLVLLPSGRRGWVRRGENLLEAARALGVELESICGGRQTCGKCQVIVEEGHFAKHGLTSAADHLSPVGEAEAACCRQHHIEGRRLACAAQILGDVLITVPEESQARKQIVAKAAGDRTVDLRPAVRQFYVELPAAGWNSSAGDWERLQAALKQQWTLDNLAIDLRALAELQPALRTPAARLPGNHCGLTVTLWNQREVLRLQPGYAEGACGLAVDVGSTTVAAHLCDLRTGAVLATEAAMNPQVRYGEDLMSRVSYAMTEPQGLERMQRAIVRLVNELAGKASAAAGRAIDAIVDAVAVGNPVMMHLLLGLDPTALGAAPFVPAVSSGLDLRARDLGLAFHPAARLHVLPCVAGHVGADHLAVLLTEAPHLREDLSLVVDVGTNAEMSLGNRGGLHCASSPTGPAFEGAQITHGQRAAAGAIERVRIDPHTLEPRIRVIGWEPWIASDERNLPAQARPTGLCGSGIIEAVAELFLAGLLQPNGSFVEASTSPRLRRRGRTAEYLLVDGELSASGQPIVVTQSDVRAIQLAKAALYAGVKLLMAHRGVERIDRVVLAGAFGSYIDPLHAMVLGMIPDCPLERVEAVGNAAGDGARLALLNLDQRAEAARLAQWVQHVQTATHPRFQEEFVAAMAIPHASDPFPHLQGILPEGSGTNSRRLRRETKITHQQRLG